MATANLGLTESTVGVDSGADAASREQTNIDLIDLHDHTSGKGVRIPTGGLNINADLPFNNNSLTETESIQFESQASNVLVANTIFVKNNELYYVDGSLNVVQLTSGGAVSVASLLSGNVFLDGGNTRGANLRLGSNDNYSFLFETNNTDRFQISGSGFMKFISDWGFEPSVNSSTGSLNDVSTSTTSYLQMTGTGSTTITGFANGTSGKTLLISNQTGSGLTLSNESASSSAANRIQTGTGNNISIADKASALLIYNSTTSRWSLLTGAATAATLTYPLGNVSANDSNVTFTAADNRVQICTPTAARTYTLPTTSISAGDTWTFHNQATTSGFHLILNASGGSTVDTVLPTGTIELVALISTPTTSAHWKVVNKATTKWINYTPTLSAGFGTATGISFKYRREGNLMRAKGVYTTGTTAASIGSITLPSTYTIDIAEMIVASTTAATGERIGTNVRITSPSPVPAIGYVTAHTSTSTSLVYLAFGYTSTNNPLIPANVNTTLGNTESQSIEFSIPISGWN